MTTLCQQGQHYYNMYCSTKDIVPDYPYAANVADKWLKRYTDHVQICEVCKLSFVEVKK